MNIKACGIITIPEILQLEKWGVDYIGLCFIPDSPLNIRKHLTAQQFADADLDIKKVGVFYNASIDEIQEAIDEYELDMVQLSGIESPEICKQISENIEVIKTFDVHNISLHQLSNKLVAYDEACDYYCFEYIDKSDTVEPFQWKKLETIAIEKPFFIGSNVLLPSGLNAIHSFKHPDFLGVDISCHFGSVTPVKDSAQIMSVFRSLQQVNN